jgi:tetrahydromethanopterin S-methyltransferase subunit G
MDNDEMNQIQGFIADMEQRFENKLSETEARLAARIDRLDQRLEMLAGIVAILTPVVIRMDSRITKLEDKA